MSKIKSVTWHMDPHTKAKHIILKKYLDAWIPILSRYNGRVIYIDGFAGPGEYIGNEEGSPIIAIKSVIEHKLMPRMNAEFRFLFIEQDKDRCNHLKKVLHNLKIPDTMKITIDIECGKFENKLGGLLQKIKENKLTIDPTFVFIDPFGFSGVPLSIIKDIMANKKCEVLITFMYEDIIRWISLTSNATHLDSLFGSDKWRAINNENIDTYEKVIQLHDLYQSKLENEASIKYVRSFMMINKYNKPDYFLFFGTNNLLGLEKMKEAMWKVDKFGSYKFSDATYNPKQSILFEPNPKFSVLKKAILSEFKGKEVRIEDLETFVVEKTEFLRSHIRKNILDIMETANPPEIELFSPTKRKKCTYPTGTVINFL